MLQDVYSYGIEHNIVKKPNTEMKQIAGYICIDENGEFEWIENGGSEKIPCPDIGTEKQGLGANAIVERVERIVPPKDKANASKNHKAWLSIMKECCEAIPEFKPLEIYLESLEKDENVRNKLVSELEKYNLLKVDKDGNPVLSGTNLLTFKIEGKSVVKSGYWENWLACHIKAYADKQGKSGTGRKMISSITGKPVIVSEEHKPKVRGGVLGKGATLTVSYDKLFQGRSSFDSYGMERGQNSAIGDQESVVIADTLNCLGSSKQNSSNNFGIFYWYSDDEVRDLIGQTVYSPSGNSEDMKVSDMLAKTPDLSSLYEAALKGLLPEKYPADTYFKIFKVTNSQERYSTREDFYGTYGELREGIFKWYKDTALNVWEKQDKEPWKCNKKAIRNIYSLLFSLLDREHTTDGPLKESKAEYGEDMLHLLYSMYSVKEIPEIFFRRAVKKGYTSILLGKKFEPVFIQVIKIYLTRKQGGIEIMEDVSVTGKEPKAYSCGRLFAVYGRIQKVAANFAQIGNDVCSRYIGMMFKHPDEAFVEMAKLSFAHMKNIDNKGYFDKKIAEITANIGTEFPQKFMKTEQAEFLLGYYRQMNIFIEETAAKRNKESQKK
ncbi:MAG: type I-C CRISPR-associated protein Cas8c/Csd1 [Lachnospiraceae bacterium]|nr:type I-C CRISPR-associated protein Cas8c/Csd1 [Lachnospiraceae bacterium]